MMSISTTLIVIMIVMLNFLNENEMNFQYLEGVNSDFLHISLHSTENVMSLKQNGMIKRDNIEEKEFHQETSA